MPLTSIISDHRIFLAVLIAIGVIGIAAIYFAYRNKEKKAKDLKKAKGPLLQLKLEEAEPPPVESLPAPQPEIPPDQEPQAPAFSTLQSQPRMLTDIFRAFLTILSLVVAAGFVLILLPQPAVDRMTQDLQSRHAASQQEKIAFLYLGDEIKDNAFHVRGEVRNITTAPIERLDAAIRFYSHDGSVLQTAVVRMNKETIAPDEIARFELVYPDYKMEFASYAVEFKLREGALVPCKDMRSSRGRP